jgi:hypothetical protein
MTLIIGCITENYAVLASDRRFIELPSRRVVDDNANKSILLCGHFQFGYTGLARLEGKTPDLWIADILGAKPVSTYFETIADNATRVFKTLRIHPELKCHTFLGVGFSSVPGKPNTLRPLAITISNCMDKRGQIMRSANPRFAVQVSTIPPRKPLLFVSAGQILNRDETIRLQRFLRRHITRGGGLNGVARLLASQIRLVAQRNRFVGKGLMVSALPRKAVGTTGFAMNLERRALFDDAPSAVYVPEDDVSPELYGPTSVCPNLHTWGARFSPDPPPGW